MSARPDRVVVISDFSAARGGASKLAVMLARALSDKGQPVTLFAGDRMDDHTPGSFEVVNLGSEALLDANPVSAAINGVWNRTAARKLAAWMDRNDTPRTIYHVHGFMQTLSPSIFSALSKVSERVVIHAHDYFLACPNGAYFDYQTGKECPLVPLSSSCVRRNCDKRSYAQKLWRLARQSALATALEPFRKSSIFILLHSGMTDYLGRKLGSFRAVTVPNPAEAFLDQTVRAEENRKFCYVGDIHDYKGVFIFAEAARRAGLKAHFIGDGRDAEELTLRYPAAAFYGWQDRNGLKRLLEDARAVVVPSRGPEPFGLAIVEAMLSGIPVIASDSILLAPDIVRLEGGLTFPAGDVEALAALLSSAAEDNVLVRRLSIKAPGAAEAISTTPQVWTERIEDTYSKTLLRIEGGTKKPRAATVAPLKA
jgi:glycosyltransferase involved in cell wall biosynthesis